MSEASPAANSSGSRALGFVLPLLVFVGLLILLGLGLSRDPKLLPSPLLGKPAPPIDLPSLHEGGPPITNASLKGSPTIVNVWASWCTACRAEHAVLLQLAQHPGVRLVGLDYKDRPEDGRAWLQELGNPYDLIARDEDGRVGLDWGVYGVPESFFLDAEGVVRAKHVGPLSPERLPELLARIGVTLPMPMGARP